ncbi:MAG: hypothetical protein O3C25_01130 [Chloroflexi bacterium]|nr:hypothetical protein [Chloroflexota bacterium]
MPTRSLLVGIAGALIALAVGAAALAGVWQGGHADDGATRLVLSSAGCAPSTVRIASDDEPAIHVANEGSESMVISVPKFALAVAVPGGGEAVVQLPRYIMGDFALFCVADAAHASAGGHTSSTALVCGLDDARLAPVALTAGRLVIEPHDRILEVLPQGPPPGATPPSPGSS